MTMSKKNADLIPWQAPKCSHFASFIIFNKIYNANWFDLYTLVPIVKTILQSIRMQIVFKWNYKLIYSESMETKYRCL